VRKLYSDNSGEIGAALKKLRIMPHNSLPGVPQNNAVAERLNRDTLEGARTALMQAGLPACFWSFAAPHYCMMENTHFTHEDHSPWYKTHGDEFHGERIPFGAKVIFKPAETKDVGRSKFEPTSRIGVFAGYELAPGYTWSGTYLIWYLSDFAGADLSADMKLKDIKFQRPHRTRVVEVPEEGYVFPLLTEYKRKNETLEGLTEQYLKKNDDIFAMPGDFDPNAASSSGLRRGDTWLQIGRRNPKGATLGVGLVQARA